MNELLAHLVGDYILQPHWMANKKTSHFHVAYMHGFLYALPFLFISTNGWTFLIIAFTHAVIDRYRLANWLARVKNWNFETVSGYPEETPVWLSTWLMIITDNTMHMLINHFALKI